MQVGGRRWYGEIDRTHPHLREHVLDEIRARGPLGSRHFDGAARQGRDVGLEAGQARCSSCSGTTASWSSPAARGSSASTTFPSACSSVAARCDVAVRARTPARARAPRRARARGVSPRAASSSTGGCGAALRGSVPSSTALVADGLLERRDRGRRRAAGAGAGRRGARPPGAGRGGAPLPVRQPALGPAVRAPRARLRPPDRGLQARPRASLRLLRPAAPRAATGSSGGPTSSRSERAASSSCAPSTGRTASAPPARSTTPSTARSTGCVA